MENNGAIQNRTNTTPKNQFRIEGDTVHILLKDGDGKESMIDLDDWPEVQNYEWFYVREGKMEYAATFIKDESGCKMLLYQHDLIIAMHPEKFGDLCLAPDDEPYNWALANDLQKGGTLYRLRLFERNVPPSAN